MNRTLHASALAALFVIGLFFGVSQAVAAPQSFKLERGVVTLDVPQDWEDVSDLFGMPLMILGPEVGGGRPVVTVTATGLEGEVFDDEKTLSKTESEYRDGRRQWLKKLGGSPVSFNPYRKIAWAGVNAAHVVGFRYKLKGIEYAESSYYVICKSKLYHLKSLLRAAHEDNYAASVDQAVRSFTCE